LRRAGAAHFFEFALQPIDLEPDLAFVLLELALAFAFRTDAAALLAEVTPGAGEARERILHPREIDLDARLAGVGAGAEDIEDDFLPVGDGNAGELFPIALLRRAELVIENEDVALELFRAIDDLLRFAGADEITRVVFAIGDEFAADNRDAEGIDEFGQFLEQMLRFRLEVRSDVCADEQRTLHGFFLRLDLKHTLAR
jgi:hypothetical protein